jgi:hypothetical protein
MEGKMKKRFFIYIIVSHFIVIFSLLFPIHRLKTGINESISFINFFEYLSQNQSGIVKVLFVILILAELLGIANGIYGIVKLNHFSIRNAFTLGFSSAILAAMLLSSGSYIFFLVCATSFLVISYFSLRLLKMEK